MLLVVCVSFFWVIFLVGELLKVFMYIVYEYIVCDDFNKGESYI